MADPRSPPPPPRFQQQRRRQQPLHVTLCALAEYYLRAAARSAPGIYFGRAEGARRVSEFRTNILAALKALNTVLSLPDAPTHVLAAVHFKIAEVLFENTENLQRAGEHISKALMLAAKQGGNTELKVQISELQVRLLLKEGEVKRAKRVLDDAVEEVKEVDIIPWVYELMIRKAVIAFDHEGDERVGQALLASVMKVAEQRGDKELRALLLLTATRYALIGNNLATARQYLDELKQFSSAHGPSESTGSLSHNRYFRLHYLLFSVILTAHLSPTKGSDEQLAEAHKLADQRDTNVAGKDGWIKVAVKSESATQGVSQRDFLYVRWLSEPQLLLLAYLASGLSRRHDSGSAKSINYCREGLKVGYGCHFVNFGSSLRSSQPNAFLAVLSALSLAACLKAHLFLQLTRSFLLRWELRDAKDAMRRLVVHLASYPALLDSFLPEIAVTYGHLLQANGNFSDAVACFRLLADFGGPGKAVTGSARVPKRRRIDYRHVLIGASPGTANQDHHHFLVLLAALSMVCALQGVDGADERTTKAHGVLENVLSELDGCPESFETLRAAALLFKGVFADEGQLEKKQHLLLSLKLSTSRNNYQLQTVALAALGDMYHLTQDRQAEKMLTAGYIIACKSRCRMFAYLSGSLLADHYRLQRQYEDCAKQCARNKVHRKEIADVLTFARDHPLV